MKLKLPNWILIVDILTVLLIGAILLIPDSWLRIVLGLPFLLFFPGYVLVEALFVRRKGQFRTPSPETSNAERQTSNPSSYPSPNTHNSELRTHNSSGMDGIERIALSFGMSIAVTALIGLGLNYTPWGIRLLPVLYSIAAFIIILSAVALFRQYRVNDQVNWLRQYTLKMPGWEGSPLNKVLTVILAVAILGTIGTLIYTVAFPKVGEKFTEFYILGLNGKADVYPSQFTGNGSPFSVKTVQYGKDAKPVAEKYARVTLGIVDQEQQQTRYTVKVQIDGQPVKIISAGQPLDQLDGIVLQQGEKWEQQIGFAPLHAGDNQKVEIFLYKDTGTEVYNSLHLWVNVVGQ